MSRIKSTHTGNTCETSFLACVAPYPKLWKITRANECRFGQSNFCPSASQDLLISSLIGSPWFCGVTTERSKGQASNGVYHDAFAAHHFYALMSVTKYAHVAGVKKKSCSVTFGAETRRYCASPVSVTRMKQWDKASLTLKGENHGPHVCVHQHYHFCLSLLGEESPAYRHSLSPLRYTGSC